MRQDQYEKLQELTEKLTDAFISEADPAVWPGHGVAIAAMDQQTRGDRYWCKKNAAATLSVLMRVQNLIGVFERGIPPALGAGDDGGQSELDKDIDSAEREAQRILARLQKDARGRGTKKA